MSPSRILVIEDEWIVAVDVQRTLKRAGYVVDEIVTNAARALATIERVRPDLVLLDIDLGGADGTELAAKLRSRSAVPIIFLSAHCDTATLRKAMRADPRGFVVKPFTEAQLLTAIELGLHVREEAAAADVAAHDTLNRIAVLLRDAGLPLGETTTSSPRDPELLASLSAREREIVERMLAHQRVPGIARTLAISENTVRNHLKSVYAKLGVHSQEELLELVVRGPSTRER